MNSSVIQKYDNVIPYVIKHASFNVKLGVKYDYSTHSYQFYDEIVMDHINLLNYIYYLNIYGPFCAGSIRVGVRIRSMMFRC